MMLEIECSPDELLTVLVEYGDIPEEGFVRDLAHERERQVCVGVNASRNHVLALGIDDCSP